MTLRLRGTTPASMFLLSEAEKKVNWAGQLHRRHQRLLPPRLLLPRPHQTSTLSTFLSSPIIAFANSRAGANTFYSFWRKMTTKRRTCTFGVGTSTATSDWITIRMSSLRCAYLGHVEGGSWMCGLGVGQAGWSSRRTIRTGCSGYHTRRNQGSNLLFVSVLS